jgi:5-methylcytosine-specific restriction endonuclease McrA
MDEVYFIPAPEEHVAREKRKAQELRRSQWWKNRRAAGRCHYCQDQFPPRELTMDHIVPVIRGGRSARSNVVPCCPGCNTRKKYLLPVEWEGYLELLGQRPG